MPAPMPALTDVTLIDLRPETLRQATPLATSLTVIPLTLEAIEDGTHGLQPGQGPFLVICERGTRSALAARYLRADGIRAEHWQAGWDEWMAVLAQGELRMTQDTN